MREFTAETCVAADHPCLAGHFPGRPIVPAVVIVERITEALRAQLGPLRVTALANAKFLAPLLPEQTLVIEIAADPDTGRARFRALSKGQLVAQGELLFERC